MKLPALFRRIEGDNSRAPVGARKKKMNSSGEAAAIHFGCSLLVSVIIAIFVAEGESPR